MSNFRSAFRHYCNTKFDGDKKAAREKWDNLKPTKKEKYRSKYEAACTEYQSLLQVYLKSLSKAERKAFKEREGIS